MKRDDSLLNARDIAALTRARTVLRRLEDAAWRQSFSHFDPYAPVSGWHLGLLSDAATVADDAIFHVLSVARHNCNVNVTDAQLGVTEPVQTEAPPPLRGTEAKAPDTTSRRPGRTTHRAAKALRRPPSGSPARRQGSACEERLDVSGKLARCVPPVTKTPSFTGVF